VHGRALRVVEGQQDGGDEGAARVGSGRGVRRAHHDASAAVDQAGDAGEHLVALPGAGEGPHGDPLGARVTEGDAAGHPFGDGRDDLVAAARRHDQPADAGALLTGLAGHLGHYGGDVGVELGRAGRGVRAQDRGVERIGLTGEAHAALDNVRVGLEGAGGSGRAGECNQVPVVEVVDQVAGAAGDELQGPGRQDAGGEDVAHDGLGEVAGGRRRLHDGRHAGDERRGQLLKHAPDREVEGVDLAGDSGNAGVDVLTAEGAVAGERLDVAVDVNLTVGHLAPALGGQREQHSDAAVDVDHRVVAGGAGAGGERVELLLDPAQVLSQLLEQDGTLVEGQFPERGLADRAGVFDHCGQVEPVAADPGDLGPGARVEDTLGDHIGVRGPPGVENVAGNDRVRARVGAGVNAGAVAEKCHHASFQSKKPRPLLRPRSPRATRSRSSCGGAKRSPSVSCRCSAMPRRTSRPTMSVVRRGPTGCL